MIYIFSIKKRYYHKIAIFQFTRPIKFFALEYNIYKFWNIKLDYKINVLNKFKKYSKIKKIFEKN